MKNYPENAMYAGLSEGDALSGRRFNMRISVKWLAKEMNPPGSRRDRAVLVLLSLPLGPEHNHRCYILFKLALTCESASAVQLFHAHVRYVQALEADAGSDCILVDASGKVSLCGLELSGVVVIVVALQQLFLQMLLSHMCACTHK